MHGVGDVGGRGEEGCRPAGPQGTEEGMMAVAGIRSSSSVCPICQCMHMYAQTAEDGGEGRGGPRSACRGSPSDG